MVCIAIYSDKSSRKHAEWTMRLINANQQSSSTINSHVTLEVNII